MASQMGFSLSLICLNRNNTVESERRHLEFTLETTYPEKKNSIFEPTMDGTQSQENTISIWCSLFFV